MVKQYSKVLLVIIDQLGQDYSQYFKRCSRLCPFVGISDTNTIPSSTEAIHSSISTGLYPKDHGFYLKRYS